LTRSAEKPERGIWIVRHGARLDFHDPEWARTASRPHDPPLSSAGRGQAQKLALRLARARLVHLFSSPFLRCLETAAPIADRTGIEIRVERGLCEWLNAEWFTELPRLLPVSASARRFRRIDVTYRSRGTARYGETGREALRRSGETARALAVEFEGNLAMVGHGASTLGAWAALLEVAPETLPDLDYGEAVELVQERGRWIQAPRR
jgi:broad specificity phosphatase PhoE